MPDVLLTTGVDWSPAAQDIKNLARQYANDVAALEKPISVKVDANAAKATVKELANSYGTLRGQLDQTANSQKQALAALIASGQKGTAEYKRLEAETRLVVNEQGKLIAALHEVEAELAQPHELNIDTGNSANKIKSFADKAFAVNQISQFAQQTAAAFNEVVSVGAEFESTLAAVGAITGQVGPPLEELGVKARQLAVAFGTSATDQLASFQGILSKLGAQVADTPEALATIATNVNILSAASGDAADTSMSAIIDSMLQFGLVTGDSNKDAATSTRVINALAASAQVGAAEIPQVAQAILQAGVAAKGAKLSFEDTNAAIQVLAVGGKTGSEAGIALRNVLGLLQKASGPAELTMRKLGTSSKELGEILTNQGLDAALNKIKGGMNNLGTAAERNAALMTIFGTENSAAAGILLDNVDKFKEFQEGIIAGEAGTGAAFEQAAIRMDTADTKIKQATARVKDAMITIFQSVGQGVSTALGAITQIAPMIQTFAGLKAIIPEGLFKGIASGIKDFVIPALVKMGVLRASAIAVTEAETVAEGVNAAVKTEQAAATGVAAIAQAALNAVMLLNPAFLVVAGIAALIAIFIVFGKTTKDLKTASEDANNSLQKLNDAQAGANAAAKASAEIHKLADSYDRLKGSTDPEKQKEFADVTDKLAAQVPLAADTIDKLNSSGVRVGSTLAIDTQYAREFADEMDKMAKQRVADAMADFDDNTKALAESIKKASANLKELRADRERLAKGDKTKEQFEDIGLAIVGGPVVATLQWLGVIDTADDKLKKTREKIAEQGPELQKAKEQLEKQVQAYKDQGLSVEEMARKLDENGELNKENVQLIIEAGGALKGNVVAAGTLENALSGVGTEQARGIRQVEQQAEAYKAAQDSVTKLNAEISAKKRLGVDTADLEKQLDEARDKAKAAKITLDATIEAKGGDKIFAGLSAQAKKELEPLAGIVNSSVSDAKSKLAQSKMGEAITEAFAIKDSLDKQGKIDELISKFKNAKTEAEKNSIAAQLQEDVPQAINGYNKLTGQFDVNIQKAEEFATAQKKGFSDELAKKRDAFAGGMKSLADEFNANSKRVAELGEKIATISKAGGDVSQYKQQWEEAKKKTQENAAAIAQTVEQGRKVGLITGDVKDLGNELHLTADQADGVAEANRRIASSAQSAAADVKAIAAAYRETQQAAADAAADNKGAARGLEEELITLKTKLKGLKPEEISIVDTNRLRELPGLITKAYADARTAILERNRLKAGDVLADIRLGEAHVDVKSFQKDIDSAKDTLKNILDSTAASKIKDDTERALTEVNNSLTSQTKAIRDRIKAISDEVNKIRGDDNPLTDVNRAQAVELTGILEKQITALGTQAQAKRDKIREDAHKKRLDEIKKQLGDEAKADDENTKVKIELLKIEEESITDSSKEALFARLQKRLQISKLAEEQEIQNLLFANEEYIKAYTELEDARATIASTTATTEEKAAATARLAELRNSLSKVAEATLANDKRISATRKKFTAERTRDELKTEDDIRKKDQDTKFVGIEDDAQREYLIKIDALLNQQKQELSLTNLTEEQKNAIIARAARARFEIEEDYRKRTNILYFASLQILRNVTDDDRVLRQRDKREELETELTRLTAEEREIRRSFIRRQIDREEFAKRVKENADAIAQINIELAQNAFDVWAQTKVELGNAFGAISDRFSQKLNFDLSIAAAKINEAVNLALDSGANVGTAALKSLEQLKDVGLDALGTIAGQMAQLALTTKLNFSQIAQIAAVTLINIMENVVSANIVAIYATSIGLLGVVGGIAAATGAIALVMGLLAVAKANLQKNLPKYHEGRVPGYTANGTEEPAIILSTEAVINPEATRANAELLRWINKNKMSGEYFYKGKQKKSKYDERIARQPISPIVVVIQSEKIERSISTQKIESELSETKKALGHVIELLKDGNWKSEKANEILQDIADKEPVVIPVEETDQQKMGRIRKARQAQLARG